MFSLKLVHTCYQSEQYSFIHTLDKLAGKHHSVQIWIFCVVVNLPESHADDIIFCVSYS